MSYKYSFADNEVYSAEDVNKITSRLVTSGIEDSFVDGVAYNVSKFNEAGQLLYTSGIVPESCHTMKVTLTGTGKILINPGMAFFNDGSVIEIENGGEELAFTKGVVNYVYLKNDLKSTNTSYPCCTTQEPEGDYVMLAVVNEAGVPEDRRTYARGKLPGYQSVSEGFMILKEKVQLDVTDYHSASGTVSFDLGANQFKYVIAIGKIDHYEQRESVAIYRIEDGKITSLVRNGETEAFFDEEKMYLYFDRIHKRILAVPSMADGRFTMDIEIFDHREVVGTPGEKVTLDVELLFI